VAFGPEFADLLAEFHPPQPADDNIPQQEYEDERRQRGIGRTEADVLKEP